MSVLGQRGLQGTRVQSRGNLLLGCFDRGAILEYMLVQVVLTLATDWADIRHLSEIRCSGVGTQEARLGVELYLEDSEVVRQSSGLQLG